MAAATAYEEVTHHAKSLVMAGKAREAIQELMPILERDHTNPEAYALMGAAMSMVGNLDSSVSCLERAVALAPGRATYHFNLACVLEQRHELMRALEQYREAYHADPNYAKAYDSMRRVEIELITPSGHHLVERD